VESSGQLHAPANLPRGNSSLYPLYRRLNWSQSQSGRYEDEKNPLRLLGIEPRLLGRPAHSLVAVLTELFRPYSVSVDLY
jgi:hypothetical protein